MAELVAEFLLARQARGVCRHYHDGLRHVLTRFAAALKSTPVLALTAAHVESHLATLPNIGARRRNNIRRMVRQLASFARKRGDVPRDWPGLDALETEIEPVPEPSLQSPEELRRALTVARGAFRIVLVLVALAGLRPSEAARAWFNVFPSNQGELPLAA